ncbi:MAG: hypothetical protein ACE5IE_02865 [Dehalococcoidia bacterium]
MSSVFKKITGFPLPTGGSRLLNVWTKEVFDVPPESVGFPEEYVSEITKIAKALPDITLTATVSTWSPTIDLVTLAMENILLRKEVERINHKLAELEERIPQEKVILLRQLSREQAKQEIQQLFASGRTLYYSDIAEELRLDLKLVVEICQELEEAGEIAVDDSA